MAKFRLKMLPLNLLALIGVMALSVSASPSGESAPSSSPSAVAELICHTDNPAECYPKIFQPTDEFQIVRPDQDLPLGLHVRLNVNTGLKEAKINVPDEHDPAVEGLPVDSSVVIVERDEAEEQIKLPPNAPAYDPAGKIKEPKSAKSGEGSAFYKSLTILKKGLDVDGALEMLEDISHDIYYGLKIAEDYDTVHELFCLATAGPSDEATLHRARLAALTLSSTVQNNPKALAEIESHWAKLTPSLCPSSSSNPRTTPLGASIFTLLPPKTNTNTNALSEADPSLTKARISLLAGLLKSPLLRTHFLNTSPASNNQKGGGNGLSEILRILTFTSPTAQTNQEAWQTTQRRAAQLLTDTFLDADMGAALGEWPTGAQLSHKECEAKKHGGKGQEEGGGDDDDQDQEACLDWHVARLRAQFKKDGEHWSHELGRMIAEARGKGLKGKGRAKGWGRGEGEKVDL